MILVARGLTKRWADDIGLAALDLSIERGTMTCLQGRSGSGKSTLLALLLGWTQPDAGALTWDESLDDDTRSSWSTIALVPQTLLLLPELSVLENVAIAATAAAAHDALASVGVDDLAERTTDALSMGQRQRVAVARALVARPTLLLADEPTSHQDTASAQLVLRALRAAADDGTAVLAASHDPAVLAASDTVITLD